MLPFSSSQISKQELERLYFSGLSMKDLSLKLNCSEHIVIYWMDKYKIARRSRSDAMYMKANPNGDPFKIKNVLTDEEIKLFGLGLGIYWGEGEKVSRFYIRVANTDYKLIKIFREFMIKICQIQEAKISYSIVCFNDSNVDEVRKYWANSLSVFPDKFGKIVQIPTQGKGIYKKKSQFGVCTISIGNIKLKSWIMKELEKLTLA